MDARAPEGSQQPLVSPQPPLPGTDIGPSHELPEQGSSSTDPSSGLVRRRAPEQIVVGTKDPADTDLTAAQKTFYGISQLPGQKASPEMKGCENLLGRSLEEAHGGQINELLGDLRSKCTAASTRLNTIADQLERECENPDLREWEYTTYPQPENVVICSFDMQAMSVAGSPSTISRTGPAVAAASVDHLPRPVSPVANESVENQRNQEQAQSVEFPHPVRYD
ncbi:hypothetical protein, conserved [Eimeria acervulina]|uniref:Uncharacterized protein n=1 Tax=Eimeria acervulina TaxID=5801 RepID=U6GQM1_EIMAC|nr:hypothetical protein, conserved [Eimeria acervulina]CDI81882.1 hypothetical protein, conserved [Eimeria acervulina]